MNDNERSNLISTWIIASRAGSESPIYEENVDAIIKMLDLVHDDPELLWKITLDIVSRDDADDVLGFWGAGPFEELMCAYGVELIDRIEEEAINNDALRKCMRAVWLDKNDTPVYKKFYDIAGVDPPFDD